MLAIVTAQNAGKLGKGEYNAVQLLGGPEIAALSPGGRAGRRRDLRAGARRGRACSASIMTPPKAAFDLAARPRRRRQAQAESSTAPPDTAVGDFAGAFAAAPVKLDATYTTPDQAHAMMEPHASIAAWKGDEAHRLDLEPDDRLGRRPTSPRRSASRRENVRLMSPFIGGGFGGKLFLRADAVLAALGARAARPAGEGRAAAAADRSTTRRTGRRRSSASASARRRTAGSPRSGMRAGRGNLPGGGIETRCRPDPAALCRRQPA